MRYAKKKNQLKDAEVQLLKNYDGDDMDKMLSTNSKITIKKLDKKTKYYVQVRSYANGQYSSWSTTKSVTTK